MFCQFNLLNVMERDIDILSPLITPLNNLSPNSIATRSPPLTLINLKKYSFRFLALFLNGSGPPGCAPLC
jgi:hypothetical protein